jgi:hypothetical protein
MTPAHPHRRRTQADPGLSFPGKSGARIGRRIGATSETVPC